MKFIRKSNKGVVFLVIIIIAVAIYLTANAVTESKDKTKIKALCEEYLAKEISYNMLPEQYKQNATQMSADELATYISKMKEELSSYYVENEQSYKYLLNIIEDSLQNQQKGLSVVTNYEKNIKEFDSIKFDDDCASVQIVCNTSYEGTDPTLATGDVTSLTSQTTDTINLQKVDGEWKVTYSNLVIPVAKSAYSTNQY